MSGVWCRALPRMILALLNKNVDLHIVALRKSDVVYPVGLLYASRKPLPPRF